MPWRKASIFSNAEPITSSSERSSPMRITVWIASVRSFGDTDATPGAETEDEETDALEREDLR